MGGVSSAGKHAAASSERLWLAGCCSCGDGSKEQGAHLRQEPPAPDSETDWIDRALTEAKLSDE